MEKKTVDELIGWYGTIAILLAYAGISFNLLSPQSLAYQLLNGSGALGIVYISFKKKAYQPGVLNVIWALIAFIAIARMLAG
jgi:hypothetical protein